MEHLDSAKRVKLSDGTTATTHNTITIESTTTSCDKTMKQSASAVEEILGYRFVKKSLLEEALTHSSWPHAPSYERLEFVGDAVLCVALSMFVYRSYPSVEPGRLSRIRAANISTEKLARLAVRHGFHRLIRINGPTVQANVLSFSSLSSKYCAHVSEK